MDSSSTADSSVTSVTRALTTELVLLHIFRYLGVPDLLDCRLVNQKWHAVAFEALKSRSVYISIMKIWESNEDSQRSFSLRDPFVEAFKFFAKRLVQNPKSRFIGLEYCSVFLIGLSSSEEPMNEFAQTCGKFVRRLRFERVRMNELVNLLDWFNQVEEICIGSVQGLEETLNEGLHGGGITLPKLRSLRLLERPYLTARLCKQIIQAAPVLNRVQNFEIDLVTVLLDCGKLSLVSCLKLQGGDVFSRYGSGRLHLKNYLNSAPPPLKSLELTCFYFWIVYGRLEWKDDWESAKDYVFACLERLINLCKDTLVHLKVDYLEKPVVLARLKSLEITDKRDNFKSVRAYRIFPTGWELPMQFYFPALETVQLELIGCEGELLNLYFGEYHEKRSFPTVKTLEVACPFDQEGILALGRIFPNVDQLRVFRQKLDKSNLADLWLFPSKLKILKIFNFGVNTGDFQGMDPVVTGFPVEICRNLRRRHRIPYDSGCLDAFRTAPCILNLRGLQQFSLYFTYDEHSDKKLPDSEAAPVSHWYAFDLMPGLRVQFFYDFRGRHADYVFKALNPYAPYVPIRQH